MTLHPWSSSSRQQRQSESVETQAGRTGQYEKMAEFSADCRSEEAAVLDGVLLCCPYTNALVRRVEAAAADRFPGVQAILSSSNPEANPLWPFTAGIKTRLFDPHCRIAGERVAAVAATSLTKAMMAASLLEIEYEILSGGKIDENAAFSDLSLGGNPAEGRGWPVSPCLAKWERDSLTVCGPVPDAEDLRATLAEVLEMLPARIRIQVSPRLVGNGPVLDRKDAAIAALLARRTGRPVRLLRAFFSGMGRSLH